MRRTRALFYMCLCARNAFVLKHPNHNTPVLGLAFPRRVRSYLFAGTHWRREPGHSSEESALLLQKVGYVGRPLLAQLLVQGCGANGGGVALYLNHIAFDGHGLLA